MTRVGIAASPAFRAGFLICAEKGFMVRPAECDNSAPVEARCRLVFLIVVG
jgi:hypothetical protein